MTTCRSPYGERGLKLRCTFDFVKSNRRSPYGERGLKFLPWFGFLGGLGRSPYGERGLKYHGLDSRRAELVVALLTESVD